MRRSYPIINRREGGTFVRAETSLPAGQAGSEDDGVVEGALRRGRSTLASRRSRGQPQAEKMASLPTIDYRIASNIKLIIEYDGTNYSGWQTQNSHKSQVTSHKLKTIQETIESTLQKILQEKVKLIASGRTDSGVHAFNQVVNFKTRSRKIALSDIQKALNGLLPKDISVKEISDEKEDFHSRYSAKSKVYRYFILNGKNRSVFLDKFSWQVTYKLNIGLMRKEAKYLLGAHDFKAFCASGSAVKRTIRTIKNISIKRVSFKLITIDCKLMTVEIEADGFLYNMVRNIVGTLVKIGRENNGCIKEILLSKDRREAGPTAPARGLFLFKVKY